MKDQHRVYQIKLTHPDVDDFRRLTVIATSRQKALELATKRLEEITHVSIYGHEPHPPTITEVTAHGMEWLVWQPKEE